MTNRTQPPKVVFLSSLFATDRILLHSTLLDQLAPHAEPFVLSEAVNEESFPRNHHHGRYFHSVKLPRGFPTKFNLLRHFTTYLWDRAAGSVSRESMWRLRKGRESAPRERALRTLAGAAAPLGLHAWMEAQTEKILVNQGAPAATSSWLRQTQPALVVAMYPFLESQAVTIAAAKHLGIPVAAFITSWDNITTKARMIFDYDSYFVWSERMKEDLFEFYPASQRRPVTVIGPPQYDVFWQPHFHLTRREFLNLYGLNANKPVIVYCLGSPNMIREDHGALQFLERARNDEQLAAAQIILRTHPGHLESGLTELDEIKRRFPHVVIQGPQRHWQRQPFQGEEAIGEWINTLRHADVVINLSSTIAIDAGIFDRPVVNLNFDPQPGRPNEQMIKEINSRWNHFHPVAQSGGVWSVNDINELVAATKTYLQSPALHRAERRWMVEFVCGKMDGRAGQRMADGILASLGIERAMAVSTAA